MRILIDTHCWLWMLVSPHRFSEEVRDLLLDDANALFFSAASSWEIAIKYALGKIPLPLPPSEYVPSRIEATGCVGLPVQHAHALRVAALPAHHRDPFDRLLVAQVQLEHLTLLTVDRQFAPYDVATVWADE